MNPLVVLSALFAAASAAPGNYAAAPAVAVAAAHPVAYAAHPVAASVPAPYTTAEVRGAPITTVEQPPAIVSKQLHYGKTQFVSGYASAIHKPAIPDFKIAVPTALKGSVAYNAPIVNTVREPHVVNEPYPVERRVEVPYDVPVIREHIEEVAVPVHVDRPYAAPYPVQVQGEPIVNVRQGPAVVQRTHQNIVAPAKIAHVGHRHNVIAPAVAHVAHY